MYNYKLEISYDGSKFRGWQKQGNTENTVQGKLEAVLSQFISLRTGEGFVADVNGAGRTDAGVHALAQTANVKLPICIETKEIKDYLNRYLPETVRVNCVSPAGERFHARLSSVRKTYVYNVWLGEEHNVFLKKYAYAYGKDIDEEILKAAAAKLIGVHDFTGFCTKVGKNKSAVREIYDVNVMRDEKFEELLRISFTGNGFLYNQVRIMTGTLLEIASGERPVCDMDLVFERKDRLQAGFTAPPHGLFLKSVDYTD